MLVCTCGSWLLLVADEMVIACLDAGALPVCERARVRFVDDPKVQQNALFAIQKMTAAPNDDDPSAATSTDASAASWECALQ